MITYHETRRRLAMALDVLELAAQLRDRGDPEARKVEDTARDSLRELHRDLWILDGDKVPLIPGGEA